jgi:uncharacterized membrane-anchored protein
MEENVMRKRLMYALLALQVLVLCGAYAWHALGLRGETYLLRAEPVDPRDLLRGDFVILSYEISRPPQEMDLAEFESDERVYVRLRPEEGFWVIDTITRHLPEGKPVLRARWQDARLIYDLERYFVPEGMGNPPPPYTVEITVNSQGQPLIKHFYANGARWP